MVLLACMFPLIWLGGLVTSTGAGMSVPDWPNTYGYNMFAVPWDIWLGENAGGIFHEHSHRLLASFVGMLAIGVAGLAWWKEPRRWVRWVAYSTLMAVCVQGLLGGLRVIWVSLDLAVIHGIFGQLTFCLAGLLVLAQTKWWHRATQQTPTGRPGHIWWAGVLTVVIVVQLVVAASMRHYGAGLAVPDWPLHFGGVLPPVSEDGLRQANQVRAFDYFLGPVSLGEVWLHMAHRLIAYGICGLALIVAAKVWKTGRLRGHTAFLIVLVGVQVSLGVLTIWTSKPADIATLHQATGALTLLTSFILTARGWVIFRSPVGASMAAEAVILEAADEEAAQAETPAVVGVR